MSRRTAEANKAILAAWNREQELVQEGKGTREWTPQQQQDILDKGKAYDENGVAFQGQHMKSVNMYPEYQGDPENIQFLTRSEHLEAHDYNWRNPTNWYFNPVTKEKIDFGDGKFIPCEIIQLAEPIVNIQIENKTENRVVQEAVEEMAKTEEQNINRGSPCVSASTKNNTVADIQKQGLEQKNKRGFRTIGKTIIEFPEKPPTATKVIGSIVALLSLHRGGNDNKDKAIEQKKEGLLPNRVAEFAESENSNSQRVQDKGGLSMSDWKSAIERARNNAGALGLDRQIDNSVEISVEMDERE